MAGDTPPYRTPTMPHATMYTTPLPTPLPQPPPFPPTHGYGLLN